MMKDLIIPMDSKFSVDLSMIIPSYNGIIIGFKDDRSVGYIQHEADIWTFKTAIDVESDQFTKEDNLLDLVRYLITNKICTNFKVIEFN